MKVREPVARPVDVVAVELLLSASQAFLVGVLMYLAIGVWDDRSVGHGPVAIILALLGLAVGGSWAYWLMGGMGWPLAAADVPVAMFLGFALVLGWTGNDLFGVPGVPLLLATLAAVYGIVGGVFIESPRRWRWDQRKKLRPGTKVPHVSSTTRNVVAAIPRSIPRRVPPPPPPSELASRIERSAPSGPTPSGEVGKDGGDVPGKPSYDDEHHAGSLEARPAEESKPAADPGRSPDADTDTDTEVTAAMPTRRLSGVPAAKVPELGATDEAETGAIVLPTSIEPRAQRSPWAWAAPPEWNRDEDDQDTARRTGGRS